MDDKVQHEYGGLDSAEIEAMSQFLKNGTYPSGVTDKNAKRSYRKKCESFHVINDRLYYGMQQANSKVLSAADRSARSVFVGNISYEVSEDQLRQVFSQAGQVVHFRLVHDRETGKPKGFGFCEYADAQAAENAQRNLNGFDLNGRQLRVDSATGGDRSADEVQQFQMALAGQQEESPYGPEPEVGKAPEAIARTVASMPPERMFELMRQMKETVLSNPVMARQLLMDNPQLAYALLQAQVVMRVVDPKVAYSMLHREQPASLTPFHQQAGGPPQQGMPPSTISGAMTTQPPPTSQMGFGGPPPAIPTPIQTQQMPPPQFQHPPPGGFGRPPPVRMPPPFGQPAGPHPGHMQQHSSSQMNSQQQQNGGASGANNANDANAAEEEQQAQMLVKVLQLTDEQIRMLSPEDRAKVIELRNQLRQQVPG